MAELIAIDNGHGYNTPGKRVPDGSMREWEFNYSVAKYLKEELEYQGFKTYMVSDTKEDTPLRTRTDKANKANATLLVSILSNFIVAKLSNISLFLLTSIIMFFLSFYLA